MTTGSIAWALVALLAGPPAPSAAPPPTPTPTPPSEGAKEAAEPGAVTPVEDTTAAEPGSDVTRYQFTGLDIDGDLRTPALLQFLARIGGEFEAAGVPHRSFMPELQATVLEDAL